MPRTLFFQGSSIATQKKLKLTPPEDGYDKPYKIGLGSRLFSFDEFDAEALVTAWNNSEDSLIAEITAAVEDDAVTFTHDTLGQDFELTMQVRKSGVFVEDQLISEIQRLLFQNNCTGGTFTLNFNGETTAAITFNPAAPNTTATNIQSALEAFTGVQVGDIQVTAVTGAAGMSYDLDFSEGQFKGLDVEDVEPDYTNITGGNATAVVALVQDGNAGTNEIHEIDMPGYDTVEVTQDEIQKVYILGNANGGTFTLTVPGFGTTSDIPYNATRVQLRIILEVILGEGNVKVTGTRLPTGPLFVQFDGDVGDTDIPIMSVDSSDLTSSENLEVEISTIRNGVAAGADPTILIETVQNGNILTPAIGIATTQQGAVSAGNNTVSSALYPLTNQTAFDSDPSGVFYYDTVTSGSGSSIGWNSVTGRTTMTFLKFFLNPTAVQRWVDVGNVVTAGQTLAFSPTNFQFPRSGGTPGRTQVEVRGTAPATLGAAGGVYTTVKVDIDPSASVNSWDVTALLQAMLTAGMITPANTNCVLAFVGVPGPGMPGGGVTSDSFNIGAANDKSLSIVYPLPGTDEIQTVSVTNSQGGSFVLTLNGSQTSAIAFGANAAAVQTIIRVVIAGAVVTGGPVGTSPLTIQFPSSNGNLAQMTVFSNSLDGLVAAVEIHRITVTNAIGGDATFVVNGFVTGDIDFGMSAAQVQGVVDDVVPGITVTGGPVGTSPFLLYFPGAMGNVPASTVALNSYTGIPAISEIQDVEVVGGTPVSGLINLSLGVNDFVSLPYNATIIQAQNAASEFYPGVLCTGGPFPQKIRFEFPSSNGNLAQMTEDNTLAGVVVAGFAETVQEGGEQTVGNVTGGFYDLGIRRSIGNTVWVNDIPWNSTAGQLQTAINAVLGASSVTCTGGPLPTDAINITFSGGIYQKHDMRPTLIRTALEGAVAQYENLVTRPHLIPATVDHVYDFAICPGRGTPGLNTRDGWKTDQLNCNWGTFTITTPTGNILEAKFRWADATALDIENALNEIFGCEVCKVYQLYTSQECAERGTEYGLASSYRAWYNRDVYRIVFFGDMADPASITSFTYAIPTTVTLEGGGSPRAIDPREFLDSFVQEANTSSNKDDFFNESYRTFLLFKKAHEAEEPLHHFTITPAAVDGTLLGWRYQLMQRYVTGGIYSEGDIGNEDGDTVVRVVRNALPVDEKISFTWRIVKRSGVNDGQMNPSVYQTLGTTALMGWDATAEQIQSALETAFPFMLGNVQVEGTLYNSWLPYEYVADTDESDDQKDLRITFISALHHLPLDEYDYVLALNVTSTLNGPTDATQTPDDEHNYPLAYQHVFSRPIPQLRNERQRFTLSDDIEDPLLIGYNGEFVSVTKATSVAELQTALNALSTLGSLNVLIGDNKAIPEKFGRSVTVYGTTAGEPFEIEFTGNGFQFSNTRLIQLAFEDTEELVYTIVTLQDGIPQRPEIQVMTLTASTYSGTFTLTYSGQTTAAIAYNANAATVQAALIALSNLGPGDVVVTGGPLPTAPMVITFAQSLNNAVLITATPTLKNQKIVIDHDNSTEGGKANSLVISEVVRGAGPRYLDTPENYDQNVCISSGDTVVVEGATAPIQFGLNMQVQIAPIGVGGTTRFIFSKPRRAFLDGQKVYFRALEGVLPTGMTARYYYIVDGSADGTFGLSLTDGGEPIEISDAGSSDGIFMLELREITLRVFARYTGQQIGLANRRTGGDEEYLAKYLRGGFTLIDLGIEEGDGLTLGRFDTMDLTSSILVRLTNGSDIDNTPAVLFLCDSEDVVYEQREGECGIAFYPEQTSTVKSLKLLGGGLKAGRLTVVNAINDEDRVGTFTLLEGNLGGVHVHLE